MKIIISIVLAIIFSSCGTSKPTVVYFVQDSICKHDYSIIAIESNGIMDSLICWKCGKEISIKDTQLAYKIIDTSYCGSIDSTINHK